MSCPHTKAAREDHYVKWETFGHVCVLATGHRDDHRCKCGEPWPAWRVGDGIVRHSYAARKARYLWEVVRDDNAVAYAGITEAEARKVVAQLSAVRATSAPLSDDTLALIREHGDARVAAERKRIADAVRKLWTHTRRNGWATPGLWVDRRAVLTIIEGGPE